MKRAEYNMEFQINKFDVNKEQNETVLKWQYIEADYFLVFINDGTYEFDLENALNEMREADIEDSTIVRSMSDEQLYTVENSKFRVFCISEKEFAHSQKKYVVPRSGMKRNISYEVRVYACSYSNAEGLTVFDAKKDENVRFIQAPVYCDINISKKFLKKNYTCTLKVQKLDDYKDGAVMYHVDGVDADFPLPANCLGREMVIMLPSNRNVNIRIKDEYKKYYRKN